MALTPKNRQDSRVLRTTLMLWAALGIQSQQGEGLLDGLAQEPVDLRRDAVDLALYYGHLQQAERILAELEGEEVRAEWTYRRAVIAWRCGQTMLAAALWREALSQGLPVTSAVSKELGKAGLVELAGEHRVTRHVKEYLIPLVILAGGGTPAEALYPKALRLVMKALNSNVMKRLFGNGQLWPQTLDTRRRWFLLAKPRPGLTGWRKHGMPSMVLCRANPPFSCPTLACPTFATGRNKRPAQIG